MWVYQKLTRRCVYKKLYGLEPILIYFAFLFSLTDVELLGAGSLLRKYVSLLSAHVRDIMPTAAKLAAPSPKQFSSVASIIESDLSGEICLYILLGKNLFSILMVCGLRTPNKKVAST